MYEQYKLIAYDKHIYRKTLCFEISSIKTIKNILASIFLMSLLYYKSRYISTTVEVYICNYINKIKKV